MDFGPLHLFLDEGVLLLGDWRSDRAVVPGALRPHIRGDLLLQSETFHLPLDKGLLSRQRRLTLFDLLTQFQVILKNFLLLVITLPQRQCWQIVFMLNRRGLHRDVPGHIHGADIVQVHFGVVKALKRI